MIKQFTPILTCLVAFTFACEAQISFTGKVMDEQHRPLASVTVTVGKNKLKTLTDSLGNFSFTYPTTGFDLACTRSGYTSINMYVNSPSIPVVMMEPEFISLTETRVNSYESNNANRAVAAAITVLNKASLDRYHNSSFLPAMNTIPGVKMDERSPGSYRLSIRGNLLRSTFGVRNVKVYWNGIPFTDASGNTYLNEIAFNNIDRIEVLKGPSGSMYGAGTGGVLLLNTNIPAVTERSISIQSIVGSYGMLNSTVSWKQSADLSTTTLSYAHQQSDGYREQTNMRRDVANFTGKYRISGKQSVSANILYSDLYYQTPGALTSSQQQTNPKQARPAAGSNRGAVEQQAALYLKTLYTGICSEYRFSANWNNTTALYISQTSFKNPTIRNYERKTEQGVGLRSVTKYDRSYFTLTFGAEYQYGFTNTSTFGNQFGIPDTLQYHDEIDSRQFNLFVQGEIRLKKGFILNGGVSYNNFHYGFLRLNELPALKQQHDFTPQVIPRISLLKKLWGKSSIYFSVSKGYSPPSIDEVHASDGIFNKQLKAEAGTNYELGIKTDIIKNKLAADAAYYYFNMENTIVSRRDINGADYYVNTGKTRQQGLELSIQYIPVNNSTRFTRQVKLWLNYTNTFSRFIHYSQGTQAYDGNKLTGISPNMLAAGADLSSSIGVYSNLTYYYTDRIPLNDANSYYAGAYQILFARIGHRKTWNKHLTTDLFFSYDRSFNNPYSLGNDLNAAGNRFFNPSSPQNLNGGLSVKFIL